MHGLTVGSVESGKKWVADGAIPNFLPSIPLTLMLMSALRCLDVSVNVCPSCVVSMRMCEKLSNPVMLAATC